MQESHDNEEIKKHFSNGRTVSDAVHPRFDAPPDEQLSIEYKRKHFYYCPQCNDFMAPTTLALREHFSPERIKHERTEPCVYCKGPVYVYNINNETRVHHDCQ